MSVHRVAGLAWIVVAAVVATAGLPREIAAQGNPPASGRLQ